jgi:hypothetical protein
MQILSPDGFLEALFCTFLVKLPHPLALMRVQDLEKIRVNERRVR